MAAASALEDIVDAIRVASGADFAFVLTLLGRLVTSRAPREMPEIGRDKLCEEARRIAGEAGVIGLCSMPREELVPYGGAAPVDVYVGVAAEQAIVCVVMASWADQRAVSQALEAALEEIEPILQQASKKRGGKGRRALKTLPDSRVATGKKRTPTSPPPGAPAPPSLRVKHGAMAGLVSLTGNTATPSPAMRPPPTIKSAPPQAPILRGSMPSIDVTEAPLGRETMIAIERDERDASAPPSGSAKGSIPDVRVELLSMGRATHADLHLEEARRMQSLADRHAGDSVLGEGMSRMTQPWVEPAADAKRATEAATARRKTEPPKVTLKLEEADGEELEAMMVDEVGGTPSIPDAEKPPRAPKPSLDIWRDAIADATDEETRKRR